ncbi:hypothetical protein QUF72_12140 [Desulfobacterales bacterium HSG2]|nr:hypothetical protein [Desulfobacterales bacterium HSG2]
MTDGRVVPAYSLSRSQTQNAQYTIDLLNLNCEYLKNKRRRWIGELDQVIQEYLANDDDLEFLADMELGIANGKLCQFHSAASQQFGPLGRKNN